MDSSLVPLENGLIGGKLHHRTSLHPGDLGDYTLEELKWCSCEIAEPFSMLAKMLAVLALCHDLWQGQPGGWPTRSNASFMGVG